MNETSGPLLPLIEKLAAHRVMVVGDVMLDEYLIGSATRLSREAPIPVLEFERRESVPGGACNPAANIAALGARAVQVGVIGSDPHGELLRELLRGRGIDPAGLVVDPSRLTTTKTRLMAHLGLRFAQQVARIDTIDRRPVQDTVANQVIGTIRSLAPQVEAICVSDYLTGVVTEPIVQAIRQTCVDRGILATADAQGELEKFTHFDLVKCNADEAARYLGRPLQGDEAFGIAAISLAASLRLRGAMLITRGAEGITLGARAGSALHIAAPQVEDVYDTVGAGDTVLAVVTLALLAGASHVEAAGLANLAAGIVVRKVGVYAPTQAELRAALSDAAAP